MTLCSAYFFDKNILVGIELWEMFGWIFPMPFQEVKFNFFISITF